MATAETDNHRKRVHATSSLDSSPEKRARDTDELQFHIEMESGSSSLPPPPDVGSFHEWCVNKFRAFISQMIQSLGNASKSGPDARDYEWLRVSTTDVHMPWKESAEGMYDYMKGPLQTRYTKGMMLQFCRSWKESGRILPDSVARDISLASNARIYNEDAQAGPTPYEYEDDELLPDDVNSDDGEHARGFVETNEVAEDDIDEFDADDDGVADDSSEEGVELAGDGGAES